MIKQPQDYVLITGGSKGIGYALAMQYAQDNKNLILLARSKKELDAAAKKITKEFGSTVKVCACDLSTVAAVPKVLSFLQKEDCTITTLVNNAGFGDLSEFAVADTKKLIGIIQVNITALTHLTRALLPTMLQKRQGQIVNIASTAAFLPGPYMAVYYATKAYVLSLGEALAVELEQTGVSVTTICPGPTKTNFSSRAFKKNISFFKNAMAVDEVAAQAYTAIIERKRTFIPGLRNKPIALLSKFLPRKILAKIVAKVHFS